MKFIVLCTIFLMATIGFSGCGSSARVINEPQKVRPTLEQVKKDMPFSVVIPNQLPHGIRFLYPLEEVSPNTQKPDSVTLVFSSPDQKYAFNVNERAFKEGMGQLGESEKAIEINGYKGFIDRADKGAFVLWNDGTVVFNLVTGPNIDEQGLIDIAKSFK